MDIAVCVICMLCCIGYGYSVPNDAGNVTLVLSNTSCENNNEYGIPFKFETVSYDNFRDLENQILDLLTDGDRVRLADYGVIRHNSLKCLKLTETPENKKRVTEIRKSISLANEGSKLSWKQVLKDKSAFIGYLPSMCVFVPLRASDMNSCFKQVEDSQCSRNRSMDITLQSPEIYLYTIASNFGHAIKGFHMLCSYVARNIVGRGTIKYSHCDLPNDGAVCLNGISKGNNETCIRVPYLNWLFYEHACTLDKRPGCWYQVCTDIYQPIEDEFVFFIRYSGIELLYPDVLYTDRKKITLLDVYKTLNNSTKCISLNRDHSRLFVDTVSCNMSMNFICKKTPYNHTILDTTINTILEFDNVDPRDHTLPIVLISVGVSIVIIFATVIVIARRCTQRIRDTSTFDTQSAVMGVVSHAPDAISAPGHAGTVDNDSNAGSVPGRGGSDDDDSNAGSVPGRGGTVDDDSNAGSVPGRGGTVDTHSYVRSVSGRAGTVYDDSFGGEVLGRTASGRINLY